MGIHEFLKKCKEKIEKGDFDQRKGWIKAFIFNEGSINEVHVIGVMGTKIWATSDEPYAFSLDAKEYCKEEDDNIDIFFTEQEAKNHLKSLYDGVCL